MTWQLRTRTLTTADHTLIMGVLNVTPDSFSDGGIHLGDPVGYGLSLWEAGADLVDVGGESTRPGAAGVEASVELDRVIPAVSELAAAGVVVSVDTRKPEVAAAAIEAGAEVINDITALSGPAMAEVCAAGDVGVVLMHMQGTPKTMQDDPRYGNVIVEVREDLLGAAARAEESGIARDRICIDPGIGFGKTQAHNLTLLANLDELVPAGYPVLVGTSRKGFLGRTLADAGHPAPAVERDPAGGATIALAVAAGAAVVRVHDVASALQAARTADSVVRVASRRRTAIGLGSNLGDRQATLDTAIAAIGALGDIVAVSAFYETAPVGGPPQNDYLNAVVVLETNLHAAGLLEALLEIEATHGRVRTERFGPRTLDLDLLLYGSEVIGEAGLVVPHPRMTERRFVLEPLLEVWPDATLPDGTPIADFLPNVADQNVLRL